MPHPRSATSPDLTESFVHRHVGPRPEDIRQMLEFLGLSSLEALVAATVPERILTRRPLALGVSRSESEALAELKAIASQNRRSRSFIGMGYSECITPPVIQRNILENPGWYTQYTPYQAEIAQGRLEALLNFQTVVMELTGFAISNASLLDEATAAAEAMSMCFAIQGRDSRRVFLVGADCHPQTIEVIRTRAEPMGIRVRVADVFSHDFSAEPAFGLLLQYPATDGSIHDYRDLIRVARAEGACVVMAADILSLALLTPPAELGADIAVGSTQRFGVPMGFGGPHAAYLATSEEHKRLIPGRLVGVSKDAEGRNAIRLALQTREQHIRRDKATSNICTAQVLLAVIAAMYAVYHGPSGIRAIAERAHGFALALKLGLERLGYSVSTRFFFDTIRVDLGRADRAAILELCERLGIDLRDFDGKAFGVSFGETATREDLRDLLRVFAAGFGREAPLGIDELLGEARSRGQEIPAGLKRQSAYLTHSVFNTHRSETEMLRYMRRLEAKDLSLTHSMIPLGSCTMKLNATAEMLPITWPEFAQTHPFVPEEKTRGYRQMLSQLESMLEELTGFSRVSLQPNAGSQGEYAGLLVIRRYHQSRGESHRNVCLIPKSAHGTNPASAALAGMRVVVVECDNQGNVDLADLRAKAREHATQLAALMVTYPSTHGVFEEGIQEICSIVHEQGGQVYMDGANMNAQIGLCRPGEFGPDVCHLNLHKTFCIPHGGGGPGMGPIGVKAHLAPFLPSHPLVQTGGEQGIGPVSAAPWGSASILPISWMYIKMMGAEGLKLATQVAILNANYIARKLSPHYPVLYRGKNGLVAHECIFDFRQFKETAGVEVEDLAKRLMDYGFHAPTISFPVPGTVMVEPTESESLQELDRFCDAMISIREEIREIESGKADRQNNVLKNAPHTAEQVTATEWNRPYSRQKAAFPRSWVRDSKFWPSVARINAVLGDRHLICACPPPAAYE